MDGLVLQSLLKDLESVFSTLFNKTLSINLLHTESNTVGGLELGIKPFVKSDLAECKLLYTIGIDKSSFFDINFKASLPSVVVMQSSHGDKNTNLADIVLPSYTFVEKTGIYYNTEGRPQKTQRALIGPNLSREDWKIVRILFHSLDKLALYETKSQLITAMSNLLPSSCC